jgi:hypothetical protein
MAWSMEGPVKANLQQFWTLQPLSRDSSARVKIRLHRKCGKRCGNLCEKRSNPQKIAAFERFAHHLMQST